ncbi:hypothetical protein ACIP3B_27940 [Streptomyces anulatus]|uniref:hypothetical protein n=1 Tax=Streptomyces anulatus TaxID=1892 RepID=UPI0033EE2213
MPTRSGGRDPHGDGHHGCARDPAARSRASSGTRSAHHGVTGGDQQRQGGEAGARARAPGADREVALVAAVVDRIRGGLSAG